MVLDVVWPIRFRTFGLALVPLHRQPRNRFSFGGVGVRKGFMTSAGFLTARSQLQSLPVQGFRV